MNQTFWVAVKALLQNTEGKFLILFKSDQEDMNPHDFDTPGGRIQRWEGLEEAIMREVQEETNLKVVVERFTRAWWFTKGDLHLVGVSFLVSCEDTEDLQLSDEHTHYFWKTKEELLNGDYPHWLKAEISAL